MKIFYTIVYKLYQSDTLKILDFRNEQDIE